MCGIAGILKVWTPAERELALRTPHAQSIPEPWLDILDDSIKHRGPDGHGRFRDRAIRQDGCVVDVALVHRRLSIIDHAGGQQPMVLEVPRPRDSERALSASSGRADARAREQGRPIPGRLLSEEQLTAHNRRILAESHIDAATQTHSPELALGALSHDRIAVVFNGCIYNHRELRAELKHAGHVFGTDHSDTEVLVHGWREWGERLPEKLDGMFALTVWRHDGASATMMRDRSGEKPLHLASLIIDRSEVTVFASTAAACLRFTSAAGAVQEQHECGKMVGRWLRFGFGPEAPSRYCSHVTPSCTMAVGRHPLSVKPFGAFPALPHPTVPARTHPLKLEELDAALDAAVASCLTADVPIGCFLSGGVDSSLIARYASRYVGKLRTFTVRMPDAGYDESEHAAAAAAAIGSDHSVLECQAEPASDIRRLIEQIGLPIGDSSLIPTYWLARAVREEVGVALSGDGGDDLFAGYERHRTAHALSSPLRRLLRLIPSSLSSRDPKSSRARLGRLASAAAHDGYSDLLSIYPTPMLARLGIGPAGGPLAIWNKAGLPGALLIDRWFYLPYDLMAKTDSAAMSVALEVRAPILSNAILDRAMNATISSLMPHGERKGLLRQVARKYLPAEIVDRPKMGFAIPIGEWFRSDYGGLRTMLLDHLNSTEPFGPPSLGIDLNMKFIRQMLDEHLGTGPSGQVKRDHSHRLYMLLVLSIWAKWLGGLSARR